MATAEASQQRGLRVPRWSLSLPAWIPRRLAITGVLTLIVCVSALSRARDLGVHYWIDEGLSIGISRHSLLSIPQVLRQDGSPPLYFMLLHLWLKVGMNENHTHLLSLLIALTTIPIAMWAGWTLFGPRAGWIAAALFALDPFLTVYAVETRMYALVVLLCLVATAAWMRAYVHEDRRFLPLFSVALTALLYTHNWGFFFAAATVFALIVVARDRYDRRRLAIDIALGYVPVALLFAAWLPSLLFQVRYTGAPWAQAPSFLVFIQSPDVLLGGAATKTALLFGAGVGLAAALRRRSNREATAITALITISVMTIVSAWVFSQLSPAWAGRYLAVGLAPVLLLAAAGIPRGGRVGTVALLIVVASWATAGPPHVKSNTAFVVKDVRPLIAPGDVVFASQPEAVPVLSHYLPPGLQYLTPLGAPADLGVTNWINALPRLKQADVVTQLRRVVARMPRGSHLLFVRPAFINPDLWKSPWTKRIRLLSWQTHAVILTEIDRHRLAPGRPIGAVIRGKEGPNPVRAEVYTRL